jgi:type I restriction enzyme R subunit
LVARERPRRPDHLLLVGEVAAAVVEPKDNSHVLGDGMQQAPAYAGALHTPFVFASNGDGILLHHRTNQSVQRETTLPLDGIHAPEELWRRYYHWKCLTEEDNR